VRASPHRSLGPLPNPKSSIDVRWEVAIAVAAAVKVRSDLGATTAAATAGVGAEELSKSWVTKVVRCGGARRGRQLGLIKYSYTTILLLTNILPYYHDKKR
jgi:hypothetical protein